MIGGGATEIMKDLAPCTAGVREAMTTKKTQVAQAAAGLRDAHAVQQGLGLKVKSFDPEAPKLRFDMRPD